jgi:hypothetical protein
VPPRKRSGSATDFAAKLTNSQITDNDVFHVFHVKSTLINLTSVANSNDSLVRGDVDLFSERRNCNLALDFDHVLAGCSSVLFKVSLGRHSDNSAAISASRATVQGSKPISGSLAGCCRCRSGCRCGSLGGRCNSSGSRNTLRVPVITVLADRSRDTSSGTCPSNTGSRLGDEDGLKGDTYPPH